MSLIKSITQKKVPALLLAIASLLCLSFSSPSFAQDWHDNSHMGGPMEHQFRGHEHGRWWDNPMLAQKVGLTDAQKKQMDDIFFKNRLQLIDLRAGLQKDELMLRPLLGADQLDEAKILSQIDTVAQDRANLEKANARMLFDIRKVLTVDQWTKLKAIVKQHHAMMDHRMDHRQWRQGRGPDGPGGHAGPPPPPEGPGASGNGAGPTPPPTPDAQPNL
jgi:Spy/CpxP family protein refolding chaperone